MQFPNDGSVNENGWGFCAMKARKIIIGILVACSAIFPGYATLAFSLWLFPSVVAPGIGAVPLQAVHFESFTLERPGMLVALVLFSFATVATIGYGLSIIFSRSDDA